MAVQMITAEVRSWIAAQLQEGYTPEQLKAAMRASGWTTDVAEQALLEVASGQVLPPVVSIAPSGSVPEPDLSGGQTQIEIDGHCIHVLLSMAQPRVLVFGGLLSEAECDELVAQARSRLSRSETVADSAVGSEVNTARTSDGMFFARGESEIVRRVETRIAKLLNWPVIYGEGLQVLHYRPGAEYQPHYDYFDPEHGATPAILERGGQRVGTLVMYLNTPQAGGATTFPDVNLAVSPVKGNAVFFSYDSPHPRTKTLHGGAPVREGEKWVATKWLRQGEFN
ncbi:2-oxoglutarate-dependent dioxygenase [Paucibacter sp. KBW04]|uniref:2OG-Fe(II) oxygenase n=1 Tax=Paucibacter sp. KBW04 TaxID=2153361 RepID=UPI000F55D1AF|nr:2OG-Fe(II) oxygenase [Paucibacter sp. KBW04]RQO55374.1 2-oxoglutarate-dependent dioxygenase [Paucibacter sp. KBW04]